MRVLVCFCREASESAADAVANVRRTRGVDHLDRLQAGVLHSVEQAFAGAEKHRGDVERQLVHDPRRERLTHRRGATGDVDAEVAAFARSKATSKPSVMKWNVVPPSIAIGSCG